jgi:hypothetical protein
MARPKKSTDGISKMEAVRQAIAKLGKDAGPAEILPFIKENFGVVMSTEMAYNYKSTALKQMGGKKRGRKPGRKPGKKPVAVAAAANGHTESISLADIQAVKALTDRLGAEKVFQLAKVLSV